MLSMCSGARLPLMDNKDSVGPEDWRIDVVPAPTSMPQAKYNCSTTESEGPFQFLSCPRCRWQK